ncbi:hypothetical protein CLNEO_11210 [Anaerotignum neopropionicum]|uniref:DUF2383 domain-containing protein n=1 Tax=Anaerotignum neopropionicum TaxID=36847 RepID=A0A136WH88_9FIRM|nr:hypothetical protein [Anaerotignum neopropionicum]KXL53895.1 hypothetical protein CLNEO_11210 [Anaerotignum neopropionicum]NCC16961.1 hypothetical protein [Clostridia bacterium]
MNSNDTIELLKECNSGSKMAVSSIDEVLDKVSDEKLKNMLIDFKDKHTKLGNEMHELLSRYNEQGKEPNPVAKSMSWIKTNVIMSMKESDKTVADLITDGCNMGVKSLNKYLNQYSAADAESRQICNELISIEEKFAKDIRCYL